MGRLECRIVQVGIWLAVFIAWRQSGMCNSSKLGTLVEAGVDRNTGHVCCEGAGVCS